MSDYFLGYSLVEIGSDGEPVFDEDGQPMPVGSVIELPVGVWDRHFVKNRSDIVYKTDGGRTWVFEQYDERTWKLPYVLLPDELEIFRTLDEAVGGMRDPFLLTFNVNESPGTFIFVRKDSKFDEGKETPTLNGSITPERMVDFMFEITEEPTGTFVTE